MCTFLLKSTRYIDTVYLCVCRLLVVLLCGVKSFIRDFMLEAHNQAMGDGDYVYISTDLLAVDNYERRWHTGDQATDALAKHAFEPLLQASIGLLSRISPVGSSVYNND